MADEIKLFEEFENYPWEQDVAFQNGLSSALSKLNSKSSNNNNNDDDIESITNHAKVYFYKRKTNCQNFNYDRYNDWKKTKMRGVDGVVDNTTTTQPDGLYPTSFQAIVDLILSGKPVPGIKSIPNIVLGESAQSESKAPQRKKPWQ